MARITKPTRQDTWRIRLECQDVEATGPKKDDHLDLGVWDQKTGGAVDSEERIYHPGGMVPPISLGGRRTMGQITLQKIYDLDRDPDKLRILIAGAGRASVHVNQQAMDINGHDVGQVIVYESCTLKSVNPPEHNSEGNDPAMIEVVISVGDAPVFKQ
jgi:hypothetical protein